MEEIMLSTLNKTLAGSLILVTGAVLPTLDAQAAEGFNVRLGGGTVGRELFVPSVPGHYGVANLIYYTTDKLRDDNGNTLTNSVVAGSNTIPVAVDFKQTQTTLLLRYTYVSELELWGGKVGATIALPLIQKERELRLTPSFPAALPAPVRTNVNNNLRAQEALNNTKDSGLGDVEIAPVFSWEFEKSKLVFSPTVILPTGYYDKNDALNSGQGNFYTIRPAISYAYIFDNGIQAGTRLVYGYNTKNKDTEYKSGQFFSVESIVYKQFGPVNLGVSAFAINQFTKDQSATVAANGNKLELFGAGFSAGMPVGFGQIEFKASKEFNGRNTREGMTFILRMAMAF
jgi:hypothetical protein